MQNDKKILTGEDAKQMESHKLLVGMQMLQALWKIVCLFLIKLDISLLYDPAIHLLDIYPREIKTYCISLL